MLIQIVYFIHFILQIDQIEMNNIGNKKWKFFRKNISKAVLQIGFFRCPFVILHLFCQIRSFVLRHQILRFKLEMISVIFLLKLNAMLQNQTYKFRSSNIFPQARKCWSISFFAYSCLLQCWTYNYFTHYLLTYKTAK